MHGADCPDGMVVRHTCDNPKCVNPKHLLVGTQLENANDARMRGRNNAGERNGMAKLTWGIVNEIRSMAAEGAPATKIAVRLGVPTKECRRIISRQRWNAAA